MSADAAKLVEALERVKRIAETEADPETAAVLMLSAAVDALMTVNLVCTCTEDESSDGSASREDDPHCPIHGWCSWQAECGRLREQVEALKGQLWSNQNRVRVIPQTAQERLEKAGADLARAEQSKLALAQMVHDQRRTRERLAEVLQAAREFVADPEWTTTAKLWQREVVAKIDAALPALASEASAAEGRSPKALKDLEPAGVGEARPAEPATEEADYGDAVTAGDVGQGGHTAMEAAAAEAAVPAPLVGADQGQGVRPPYSDVEPSVSAPAEEQPDARVNPKLIDWWCAACERRNPGSLVRCASCWTLRQFVGVDKFPASGASAPLAALTKERDGLREQLDAAERRLELSAGDFQEENIRAEALEARVSALTEQLDALATAADAYLHTHSYLTTLQLGEALVVARAALGVVAAAEQTTDLEANSAKNAEVRATADKEAS